MGVNGSVITRGGGAPETGGGARERAAGAETNTIFRYIILMFLDHIY